MFQGSSKHVQRVFQGCYKGVLSRLRECFKKVSSVFEIVKGFEGVLGFPQGISKKFKGCFR